MKKQTTPAAHFHPTDLRAETATYEYQIALRALQADIEEARKRALQLAAQIQQQQERASLSMLDNVMYDIRSLGNSMQGAPERQAKLREQAALLDILFDPTIVAHVYSEDTLRNIARILKDVPTAFRLVKVDTALQAAGLI